MVTSPVKFKTNRGVYSRPTEHTVTDFVCKHRNDGAHLQVVSTWRGPRDTILSDPAMMFPEAWQQCILNKQHHVFGQETHWILCKSCFTSPSQKMNYVTRAVLLGKNKTGF